MFWGLKNIQRRIGKQLSKKMEFIRIATTSDVIIYCAQNIPAHTEVIIIFNFYKRKWLRKYVFNQFKFKMAAGRAV